MKMAAFEHHRPDTLEEVVALLAGYGSDAKVLAGGQSLVPMLAMRLSTPAHLVDVTRVAGLDRIGEAAGGGLEIGATVRHATAEHSPVVADRAPLVSRSMPWIGHRAIRNRGTVCGSLAHADPAAELPAVALALDATMELASARGTRRVSAADYFAGYLSTSAADDEVLVSVQVPTAPAGAGTAVVELSRRHGDFALVGVACQLVVDEAGAVATAALALFGVGGTPIRAADAEALLAGQPLTPETMAAAAAAVSGALDPPGDAHATAAYRRHVAGVLTRRALAAAAADAGADRKEVAA